MTDTAAFPFGLAVDTSRPLAELPIVPWPEQHIGCNVTTCPNGKCRATGECIDLAAERARQSEKHGG